jgi:serine protease AprX
MNLGGVLNAGTPPTTPQNFPNSAGNGSLEASRGSRHVVDANGTELTGEQDIFGDGVDTSALAGAEQSACAWNGGTFNGATWSGSAWSGSGWDSGGWTSGSWSGASWSGASWSGATWSGASWSGATWSGASWSGASWSGASWSSDDWS